VVLALLMGGGWPIRYCGTVAGFEIVAVALPDPTQCGKVGDLESTPIESRSHCKSRTYNLLLGLLSSVVDLILDRFIQWVQGWDTQAKVCMWDCLQMKHCL